ncbi:MAG TPA: SDR family NAD(P)-dependent oxidoreductase, partial [Thermoanaerobaculia bacterium]|nr:SDR family NAD(P)-dependent oxidoreductase [Thermoanaerobaculia bacterium]
MIRFEAGDVFLVTGASAGIGARIASLLVELGATVVVSGRDRGRLESVRDACSAPARVLLEPRDLSDDLDELPGWVIEIAKRHGPLRGLVHSAGAVEVVPLKVFSASGARRLFDLNYVAGIALAKGFARKGT